MHPNSSSSTSPSTTSAFFARDAGEAPRETAASFTAFPSPPGSPCNHGDGKPTPCPQLAEFKAELARYANAVDCVRDLVRALRAASEGNGIEPAPELYWPHLLEVVERVLPGE
jgi:hypothetical protein